MPKALSASLNFPGGRALPTAMMSAALTPDATGGAGGPGGAGGAGGRSEERRVGKECQAVC